jgi:LacI family transcriptional regulator
MVSTDDCIFEGEVVNYSMATIREIAELAGVSRGTVDRVLNKRGSVHPDTEQRIQQILRELNYQPNRNARALSVQKKTFQIAYIYRVTEINEFFEDVLTGLKTKIAELNEHRINLLVRQINFEDIAAFVAAMEEMRQSKVDGFILTSVDSPKVREKINALIDEGFPVFTCNVDIPDSKRIAFAGCNLYRSGYISGGLISILVGGHAQVGIVTSGGLVDRVRGFIDAVTKNHPNIRIAATVETDEDIIKVYNETRAMMEKNPDIKGIFAETVAVYGVCRALMELGLDKKVKVICFDEFQVIRLLLLEGHVSAIVCQNPFWQGYRSFEMLWDYLIHRRMPEKSINYSITEIRIRESMEDLGGPKGPPNPPEN